MNSAALLYFAPVAAPGAGGFGNAWLEAFPPDFRARLAKTNTHCENVAGPEGKRGVLATWQSNVLLEYNPKQQDWRRIGPNLWAGVRRDYRPEEFAKPRTPRQNVSSYPMELGDGRRWLVPVALADSPNFSMPWVERFGEDGGIVREVAPAYAQVCAVADDLWRHVSEEGRFDMDEDRLRQALADALAVHYRVDLADCLALGLFTSESYQAMICAILDFPGIEDIRRGKARAPSDTGSGGSDASAGTNPPMPTSQS